MTGVLLPPDQPSTPVAGRASYAAWVALFLVFQRFFVRGIVITGVEK